MTGDVVTKSGLVIPESAHLRYLAHQRRRRRQAVRFALNNNETVPYSAEQLQEDGWGVRQIARVTR
jgi:hypothetical protein